MPLPFFPRFKNGWQAPDLALRRFGGKLAVSFQSALLCQGSLTRYLEALVQQPVGVRVESQESAWDWQAAPPLWDDCPTPEPQKGEIFLRNAWLELGGQAWVFAHSQVAVADLPPAARQAIERGREPLGPLFMNREARVERQGLQLARAHIPELAARLECPAEQVFWCRRSLFRVNGSLRARILELFLMPFERLRD